MEFFTNLWDLFIDMSFYLVIGILFTGVLHAFVKKSFILKHVGGNSFVAVVKASVVGVPLPLCSCGVVPMALYLGKNGASKGATVSFLTSTPQTGVDSIIATTGMLGGFFAAYRAIVAFISGIIAGCVTNLFCKKDKDNFSENIVIESSCCCGGTEENKSESDHCCCGTKEEEKVEEHHCCCGSKEEEKVEEHHCCCGSKEEEKVEEHHCCCGSKEEEKVEEHHCCCGSKEEEKVEEHHCCCGSKEEEKVEEEHHCCCGSKEEATKAPTCSCCADMEAESTGCSCTSGMTESAPKKTFMQKIASIFTYGFGGFLDEIAVNFVVGIVIAALITTLVPTEWFTYFSNPWLQMLLMLVVGIPMYVCSTASIPIVVALVLKGLSPGAAFVFLFAGPVTNIASLTMLTKNLGKKVMAIYLGSVAVCSMFFGFILDLILEVTNYSGLDDIIASVHGCDEPVYQVVIASIFGILVLWSLYRKLKARISRT